MTFKEYQEKAKTTALYDSRIKQFLCSSLGLNSEINEYLNTMWEDNPNVVLAQKELGDALWYLAIFSDYMGVAKLKYIPDAANMLDLPSAVAEFQELVKKTIRDYDYEVPEKYRDDIIDFLYNYYSSIQDEIEARGWTIIDIMNINLKKLSDRQVRGVLSGDGDER